MKIIFKHSSLLVLSLITLILFVGCSNKATEQELAKAQWREMNESIFKQIADSPEYTKKDDLTGNGFIMYKELKKGSGETPIYTDRVQAKMTGFYFLSSNIASEDNKYEFFSNENEQIHLAQIGNNNVFVPGISTALQHMKEGDRWEVWIPWMLAFGNQEPRTGMYSQSPRVRAYTTVVYEIELVKVQRD